jgi:hypothetical protein
MSPRRHCRLQAPGTAGTAGAGGRCKRRWQPGRLYAHVAELFSFPSCNPHVGVQIGTSPTDCNPKRLRSEVQTPPSLAANQRPGRSNATPVVPRHLGAVSTARPHFELTCHVYERSKSRVWDKMPSQVLDTRCGQQEASTSGIILTKPPMLPTIHADKTKAAHLALRSNP